MQHAPPAAAGRTTPVVWLVSLAWLGPALLAMFQTYMQGRLGHWDPPPTWRNLLWEGGDWLIYGLLTPIVFLLARRFPIERRGLFPHLAIHLAGAVLLCAAWAAGGRALHWILFREPPTVEAFISWFFISLPFGVAVYFAVLGVEHAVFHFLQARERETQAARLTAQLAEARLGALRMQLQPHFLFNSLNAITVIVRDRDPATATRLLEQLGDMLRRVMRQDRPQEVGLAEELDFVRQYLAIEEVRFSDRLRVEYAIDPALASAAVPEFVLQPLVENAVRHGVARRTEPSVVRIGARREGHDLILTVSDQGPGPAGAGEAPASGVGLSNIRERIRTLYGERAELLLAPGPDGGTTATVRLPYHGLTPGAEQHHG
jgi:hypothetical protein